jgi:hypothetical protein
MPHDTHSLNIVGNEHDWRPILSAANTAGEEALPSMFLTSTYMPISEVAAAAGMALQESLPPSLRPDWHEAECAECAGTFNGTLGEVVAWFRNHRCTAPSPWPGTT